MGTTITSFDVTSAIGGTVLSGTIALTTGSASVTGTGTHFTTDLQAGQSLVFGADTSHTVYQIAAVANDTSLTLTTPYSGTAAPNSPITRWSTTALKDYGLVLSVSQPTTIPKPLPLTIRVFAKDGPIPQTVAGLAAQLERTINAALAVQWPGASVRCSVDTQTSGTTTTWAIRINGLLPSLPTAILSDAVLSFAAPPSPLGDAAGALGLSTPAVSNVAHYTLGSGNAFGSQTASVAGKPGNGLPGATQLIGDELAFTGIYALQKIDLFNLLSIPDATRAAPGNPSVLDAGIAPGDVNAIYAAAISLCQREASHAAGRPAAVCQ